MNVNLLALAWIAVIALTPAGASAAPTRPTATPPRASPPVPRSKPDPRSNPAPRPSPARPPDGLLWDTWYTVTVNGRAKYSYYNEKVSRTEGRIHYQYNSWKAEEGFLNEESLGAFAKDTPFLEPLLFHFRSSYRSSETTIDGTLQPPYILVKVRRNGSDLPPMKRTFEPKALLSGFFPVWFKLRLPLMKVGQSIGFRAVAEDNIDLGFTPFGGLVRLEPPDELCRKNQLHKLTVNYRDIRSVWYLDVKGIPFRIEMPGISTVIEKATESEAKRFLEL